MVLKTADGDGLDCKSPFMASIICGRFGDPKRSYGAKSSRSERRNTASRPGKAAPGTGKPRLIWNYVFSLLYCRK
jgi:hypothetical protein